MLKFLKRLFETPRCHKCGTTLVNHGGSAGGIQPEPIYVCENKECDSNKTLTV